MSMQCQKQAKSHKRNISFIFVVLFLLVLFCNTAQATSPGCKATPATAIKILMTGAATAYNIFPIRIGGVKIMSMGELDDFNLIGSFPICICKLPPPIFIRVGITFSLWEPARIIETVHIPWCSPTVGMHLPVPFNQMAIGGKDKETGTTGSGGAQAQAHIIAYPLWFMFGLFLDVVCLQPFKGFDYLYLTELDPLWQNDMWATLLGPEAVLVSNPIAQFACIVDSVAANVWRGLDPLFWCVGSWGGTYPMSQNIVSDNHVESNAGLAARMISKMHRQLLFWGTAGPPAVQGWCQRYPAPIWFKSHYNLLLLHPIPQAKRTVIGRSGIIWSAGKNPPFIGGNFVWMIYNKRDCCLL